MAGRKRSRRKKSSLATYSKKVSSRKKSQRQNAALVGNPAGGLTGELTDAASLVLPGAGAYALSRVGGRVTYGLVAKKNPKVARHVGPLGSIAVWAGMWFASTKSEWLSQYTLPIVVGGGIAAVQTLLQTYLPVYGWILSDYEFKAAGKAKGKAPAAEEEEIDVEEVEDPEPQNGARRVNGQSGRQVADKSTEHVDISDIVGEDYAGSLQSGWGVN